MRDAALYLEGSRERWLLWEDFFDGLAVRIVSGWNPKGAEQLAAMIRNNRQAREEGRFDRRE